MAKYLLLLFLLIGCTVPVEEPQEFEDCMNQRIDPRTLARAAMLKTLQWGQSRSFEPPWQENEERAVVTLDQPITPAEPECKSVILSNRGSEPLDAANFIFRWKIQVGVGGGMATFVFDANQLNQIALPLETARISLRAERMGAGVTFQSPLRNYQASAFLANFPVTTSPPTYSIRYVVPSLNNIQLFPPAGAVGFRILTAIADPSLTANVTYQIYTPNGALVDEYAGTYLAANRGFVFPFTGNAGQLTLLNADPANPAVGWVAWILDL